LALKINAESVSAIAKECAKINCLLIFISTDYVFNGNGTEPYKTNQPAEPLNYYGYTKHIAEKSAVENWNKTLIIRTAWVYSAHGHNFVKTMLRLMNEKDEIKVVNDQIGSPTYAADLAKAILHIILQWNNDNKKFGTYHYTNSGIISWYDFATEIKALSGLSCNVLPVSSAEYPTPAKRPAYSVMDTHNIVDDFGVELQDWKISLKICIDSIRSFVLIGA
jgi:dTDP-4-dehydrorhamnose reductase